MKFAAGTYRSGDYWLIPARTATADIEWPAGKALSPHGIEHHYCRIAVAEFGAVTGGAPTFKLTDCRPIFPPLTELPDAGGDLKKHNKYLHGWGVVCGLQVHCGGDEPHGGAHREGLRDRLRRHRHLGARGADVPARRGSGQGAAHRRERQRHRLHHARARRPTTASRSA